MDYSFLKLYNSIESALNDNEFKDTSISYYTHIQLSPKESYCQMTNYDGGISLSSNFECFVVDNCDNTLADITDNVFIEEFVDELGNTQCKIELINLNVDFYGKAVYIKITSLVSDVVYYTRPIKITDKNIEKTYRLDYRNNGNLLGLSYVNADIYQSIRLQMMFTGYSNNSEVGDYYQISNGNTISTRPLRKIGKSFSIENIDTFTFVRLQELLFHDTIYLDGVRITDNPILESDSRLGQTNIFRSTFSCFCDESDTYEYDYQVWDGLVLSNFIPVGNYVNGTTFTTFSFDSNTPITLNTGNVIVRKATDGSLVANYDESVMSINNQTVEITTNISLPTGTYYVNISEGLVSAIGIDNDAITDSDTWAFSLINSDYSSTDYNNTDYFTGI
jgi:hypothetical protein